MIVTRLLGLCVSLLIVTSLCSPTRVYAHSPLHSLDATYVPWGVDEDELIGLKIHWALMQWNLESFSLTIIVRNSAVQASPLLSPMAR